MKEAAGCACPSSFPPVRDQKGSATAFPRPLYPFHQMFPLEAAAGLVPRQPALLQSTGAVTCTEGRVAPRVTLGLATLSTQSCSTGAAPPGFSFLYFQAQNSSPGLARRDPTGSNLPQSTRMCVNTSQRWFCSCLLLDPAQQTFGRQQLHLQHGPTLWCRALKYSPGGWERRGLTGRGDLDGMGGSIGKGLSVRGRS